MSIVDFVIVRFVCVRNSIVRSVVDPEVNPRPDTPTVLLPVPSTESSVGRSAFPEVNANHIDAVVIPVARVERALHEAPVVVDFGGHLRIRIGVAVAKTLGFVKPVR